MEGKYFFNGKDISMNLYIQIRDVIDIIMEKSNLSFPDAMGKILSFKNLQGPTKYRKYSLGGICRLYCRPLLRRTRRSTNKQITNKKYV